MQVVYFVIDYHNMSNFCIYLYNLIEIIINKLKKNMLYWIRFLVFVNSAQKITCNMHESKKYTILV